MKPQLPQTFKNAAIVNPVLENPAYNIAAKPALSDALPRREILGLPVIDATTGQTVEALLNDTARSRAARSVFFLNAHCANQRASNRAYATALARADVVLPDGIGIELAARMTGGPLTENLNGTDFTPALLREAAKRGLSVFLFGGKPGTAESAAAKLTTTIPGLRIAGALDGYDGAANEQHALARINASGADILLVAMGVPMQELWIDRHLPDLSPRLVLGVGALFDFLAGNVRRAPAVVRQARMEWAWRLLQEPRRLAKRYLIGNGTFLARASAHALRLAGREAVTKRAMDIVLSGILTTLLSPLLLLVVALIKIDSKGPALFKQERVGRNGRIFTVLKFRTMHTDAEERLAEIRDQSDREGICFKSRNDPRVTRVGRFLRRYSVDELPQILNVLFGDMSLVGPRPALPREVAAYPQAALERLKARPGITGLWQVSGRADIGFDKMIDMDVAYVRSRSVLLDVLLLALTARAVLSGRGAY
ncbi:WecB/TagA/CpsF family glycosyltransferase [Rhodalgimonas zhirmunskyi]|uniref:WecB/TagA/CpsF family glycosyltransferase n=1 Tax=Rhodalgimonas zhirmunskyi TaxID=2964767 RepID=A0AAJ1UBR6_9RHOB|nr:WecB/TagA/CpsF family glycosyltransferase [Rhodoalgimonas zhirmunskyi]MDQ2094933.1 WecB/TagA/CpsF family glycosyltransferase [Rhodoalgimonas zhirmunskyi]